jgi:hypothetical protein
MTSRRERMTNPFAILTLHAVNSYHKALTEVSSNQQSLLPKILIYTVGTSFIATAATVIYKSMKKNNTSNPSASQPNQRPHNFLYRLSLPLKYLYYKIQSNISTLSATTSTTETTVPTPFEDKYFKEYDEWSSTKQPDTNEEHKKECLENMYYSTVRDTINDFYGDVIMCYDHKTSSFAYYARTGNIPYKYLETISRKYMIETNAPKEIHVDIRSEYNKAKEINKPTTESSANAGPTSPNTTNSDHDHDHDHDDHEDTVFVRLKSYNNASNLKIHTNTTDKTSTEKKDTITKPESNTNPNIILRENANRYSYRGKITDFEEHHKSFLADRRTLAAAASLSSSSSSPSLTATTTSTRYSDFKKQMMKSAL